jgi:hypothetical protein
MRTFCSRHLQFEKCRLNLALEFEGSTGNGSSAPVVAVEGGDFTWVSSPNPTGCLRSLKLCAG